RTIEKCDPAVFRILREIHIDVAALRDRSHHSYIQRCFQNSAAKGRSAGHQSRIVRIAQEPNISQVRLSIETRGQTRDELRDVGVEIRGSIVGSFKQSDGLSSAGSLREVVKLPHSFWRKILRARG